jgi:hypothetical protein
MRISGYDFDPAENRRLDLRRTRTNRLGPVTKFIGIVRVDTLVHGCNPHSWWDPIRLQQQVFYFNSRVLSVREPTLHLCLKL